MILVVLITVNIFGVSSSLEFGAEFCQLETFSPRCSSHEVVFIEKAMFGRMREGKCITEDEVKSIVSYSHNKKYFHCSVDVTDLLHSRCSFSRECSLQVSDKMLKIINPCGSGVFLNLEVKHRCIPVYLTDQPDCHLQVFQESKYFLFESFRNKLCGKYNNPWILEVSKGQKISLTVIGYDKDLTGDQFNHCESLGITLQDGPSGANSSLCKKGSQNEQIDKSNNIYSSTQNIIKMYITDPTVGDKKLALKFQAEGCLDILPPEDTWLKRTNDDIVIGCYNSKQTWYLRCEHRQWVGAIGNCTQHLASLDLNEVELKKIPKNQQILAIAAISGVGVVICSLIICVGAVCARRYSLSDKGKPFKFTSQMMAYDSTPHNKYTYNTGSVSINNSGYDKDNTDKLKNEFLDNSENNQTYFVLEDDKDGK